MQKGPGDAEFFGQRRGEGFDSESFRGVVAAVKNVDAGILGQRMRPVRAFAGDEGVHAFLCRQFQFRPCAACDDANALALCRAAGQKNGGRPKILANLSDRFFARNFFAGLPANEPALSIKKWFEILEAERGAQLRIVAHSRMGIQRQMRAVHGQIILDEQLPAFRAACRSTESSAPRTSRDEQ